MKNTVTFSLILPCYNEGIVLKRSVERIRSVLEMMRIPYEILLIDDKSVDDTKKHIAYLCKKYPRCHGVYHDANQGRGKTVTDGIALSRGRVIGYMDVDCEVSPVYIPEIVDLLLQGKQDMVIGKRVYRSTITSYIREILSVGYRSIVSRILNTRGIDTESGYKFFTRRSILPIVALTRDTHWFWDTEIVIWALRKKLRVLEYPVLYLRREDKKSTVRIVHDTIEYLRQITRFKFAKI